MSRIILLAAVAVAAAVAVPSVAQGATVHSEGRPASGLLVQADPGETNLISVKGTRFLEIRDDGTPLRLSRAPMCKRLDTHAVRCKPLHRVELDLQDGPDVAVVDTPHAVSIEGGNGPDRYVSTAGDAPSRVDFDGGIGFDTANYFYATTGVHVSLDLAAGDGRPGDDDRIRRNTVESVIGSRFDDVLAGGHFAEHLSGSDGDDRIAGGPGADVLSGGPGNDRIDARDGEADTVDCGGGLLDWAAIDLGIDTPVAGCAEVVGS